jgi:ubiquinone/menaquinone biosynthesis C-methylase UbiE
MKFTGERLLPNIGGKAASEHLARYAFATSFTKDKCVLDIACGEGYGSYLLSKSSKKLIGVDLSHEIIKHATKKYSRNNLSFCSGSIFNLPFEKEYFDVIVCFETIEHVLNQEKAIEELKRVLKPNGILIISTPEKDVFNKDGIGPYSHFHEKELSSIEFSNLINSFFMNFEFLKQVYINGSLIYPLLNRVRIDKFFYGGFSDFNVKDVENDFSIIIASDSKLVNFDKSLLYNEKELAEWEINYLLDIKMNKILKGFRYRFINFLFKPLDYLKSIFSR